MKRYISLILAISIIFSLFTIISFSPVLADDNATNLTVTSVGSTTSTAYDGDKITFFATVRNIGSKNAEGNISVAFYINGKKVETAVHHGSITAGGLAIVSTTLKSPVMFGVHKLTAIVNEKKGFPEEDFSDNNIKSRIIVLDEDSQNPADDTPLPAKTKVTESKSIKVEGEDCTYLGDTYTANKTEVYSGKGYAVINIGANNGVSFKVNVPESAKYNIVMHLANGTEYRQTFTIKTGSQSKLNSCGAQYDWGSWSDWTITSFNLNKGENTITLNSNDANQNEIYLDYFLIKRASGNEITSFKFLKADNPKLYDDIPCSISEDRIKAFVSAETDITNLVARFTTASGVTVKVGDTFQENGITKNNFTNGQYYDCYKNGELSRRFSVVINRVNNTNLPNMYFNIDPDNSSYYNTLTTGGKAQKDIEVPVVVNLVANTESSVIGGSGNFAEIKNALATMHIRGNTTAEFPKKAYKIKFDSKQQIFDMDKSKHWVLLANYDDKTMMRQYIGFKIAEMVYGEKYYTPKMRYVNVYLEGNYLGVYLIGQNVRAAKERVNITEMTKTATNITGGYILELDKRKDEDPSLMFVTSNNYPFTIKEPDVDVITDEMREYIKGYLEDFFKSLKNPENQEYRNYIDVESFVDWYLMGEIMKVTDWTGTASIMLHKDKDGPLYMGPVWDFLPGSGLVSASNADPTGYRMKGALWYKSIFADPEFEELVKAKYKEIRGNLKPVEMVDELSAYLKVAQADNYTRWTNLGTHTWGDYGVYAGYNSYVKSLRNWLEARIEWLDSQWLDNPQSDTLESKTIDIGYFNDDLEADADIPQAEADEFSDYDYSIENDEVKIIKYNGNETVISIPSEIEGYPVTEIGDFAFFYCKELTSVTIPSGVKALGKDAFGSCDLLASIKIPNSVTSIGDYAFRGDISLTSVILPNGVKSIGEHAFTGCTALSTVTIPQTVTSIGANAFYKCKSLTSAIIPNGVTSIEDGTFYNCVKLTSVTLPDDITSIGANAFYGCELLNSVTIPTATKTIGENAFYRCESLSVATIPDGATTIGDSAFYSCTSLSSVIIPNTVTTIGKKVFYCCTSLKSLTIPNSVITIDEDALGFCDSLTSIIIGKSVTSIGNYAFYDCEVLKDVYFAGSKSDWDKITVGNNNNYLLNATFHYNHIIPDPPKPSGPEKYDLNITAVTPSTTTVNDGDSTKFAITLRNISSKDISNKKVNISFYYNGALLETSAKDISIKSNGFTIIQSNLEKTLFFGTHSVKATVSFANEKEAIDTSLSNNTLKSRFKVLDE
jgi:hypothetical protein